MKVCMFVKNSFEYDARVTKEATALIGAGHRVTVVAIHAPGTAEAETLSSGIDVVRVRRLRFGLGALQRRQQQLVTEVERRRAAAAGEPIDIERIRRDSTLIQASTATPGDSTWGDPAPAAETAG